MGGVRNAYNILVKQMGRDHLGDACRDRKIILKLNLKKCDLMM
jgi:hypothetical protein